jgi:uncharacterized protein YndB with AHSA1/START domain
MNQDKEVNIEKIFDAPREIVFKAWAASEHLSNWYAPGACSVTIYKLEFEPDGVFQHSINLPDGTHCKCKGEYTEIIENEKIVYKLGFCDDDGNFISASDRNRSDWPGLTLVTVTFQDINGKTNLILHQTVSAEHAKKTGAYRAWLEMLDKLDTMVKKIEAVR